MRETIMTISKCLGAVVSAIIFASSVHAQGSQDIEGEWYISGFVGAAFPSDQSFVLQSLDLDTGLISTVFDGEAEFDTSVYFGGAIGRKLGFKFLNLVQPRIEIEASYFSTSISEVDGLVEAFGLESVDIDGDGVPEIDAFAIATGDPSFDTLFVLANSYSDLIWQEDQAIVPYIGGGLGVAIAGDIGNDTGVNFTGTTTIGATIPVGQFDFFAEGRYFRIYSSGPDFDGFTAAAGLRWKF